jgi:hypothetical protein
MDSPTERDKLFNSHNSSIESVDLHDNADNYNYQKDVDQRNANIKNMLTNAVQTAHDTEIIGRSILLNLDDQRHQIIEIKKKLIILMEILYIVMVFFTECGMHLLELNIYHY